MNANLPVGQFGQRFHMYRPPVKTGCRWQIPTIDIEGFKSPAGNGSYKVTKNGRARSRLCKDIKSNACHITVSQPVRRYQASHRRNPQIEPDLVVIIKLFYLYGLTQESVVIYRKQNDVHEITVRLTIGKECIDRHNTP